MKNFLSRIGFCTKVWWQVTKGSVQLVYGAWKISRLMHPIVTVFGGARLKQDSPYALQAHELAHKLIKQDISVITGGGPGIMRAASCGATHEVREYLRARSIGIAVEGLGEAPAQECAQEYLVMSHFWARKWLMINYSVAFAVFPGGFGTVDEFAQVITLIQTKKLPGVPVVLIGTQYWQPFMDWAHNSALKEGLISEEDVNLIRVTDDIDQAFMLLKERCDVCNVPVEKLKKKKG